MPAGKRGAPKRVNVDFPAWVVEALDRESRRLGVTRQSLVKLWIAERLEQLPAAREKIGAPAPAKEVERRPSLNGPSGSEPR
jgi:hypothetical protein